MITHTYFSYFKSISAWYFLTRISFKFTIPVDKWVITVPLVPSAASPVFYVLWLVTLKQSRSVKINEISKRQVLSKTGWDSANLYRCAEAEAEVFKVVSWLECASLKLRKYISFWSTYIMIPWPEPSGILLISDGRAAFKWTPSCVTFTSYKRVYYLLMREPARSLGI